MPLYEYECTKCHHRFERIVKFSDAPITKCPKCKGKVEQMISAPAIQFKGSGWYVTDYSKSGSSLPASDGGVDKSDSKDGSKSETKSAPKSETKSDSKTESKSDSKTETKSSKPEVSSASRSDSKKSSKKR